MGSTRCSFSSELNRPTTATANQAAYMSAYSEGTGRGLSASFQ